MSDEQREASFEEVLINRMATRNGVLQTQVEALQLQLEMAQQENERLKAQIATDVEPPMNGEKTDEWQPAAPT
jgi:cell division protein FtsB